MRRKLIKQGLGGFTIYLPKKWVDAQKLKEGKEIEINQINNTLVISSNGVKSRKEAKIKLTNLTESSIRTIITNVYRLGYDSIFLDFATEKHFKIIKKVIKQHLLGFDIIKRTENSCIIESISEPSEQQFNIMMQKMLYNISEILQVAENTMQQKETFEDYNDIEVYIKQYDNFCKRVIAKHQMSEQNAQLYWTFLSLIVHAQREIYYLLKHLENVNYKFSKSTVKLVCDIKKMFDMIKKSYLKKDISLLEQVHEAEKKLLYNDAYGLLGKNKESIIIYHLTASLRQFYLATSPLMGLLI